MTNNEKITTIENKIREECDWLMEMSFGCLLHRKNEGKDYGYYQVLENGSGFHPDLLWVSSRVFGKMQIKDNEIGTEEQLSVKDITDKFEILGHPIQLSNLLYVLNKMKVRVAIDGEGMFLEKEFGGDGYYCAGQPLYDLTKSFKENLEQSPELVEFLFNLICK